MLEPSRASVPGDHPCLAGHFPGRPVVPAVLILELTAAAAREKTGARIIGVRNAKFVAPLLPDQSMRIVLEPDGGQIRFRCERDGQLIAQGSFDCER